MWARILLTALLFSLSFGLALSAVADDDDEYEITDPENTLVMELETGRALIEMRPDLAPNHVQRIKELVREGFYADLVIIDPDRIRDRATFENPHQFSEGVDYVFVAGTAIVAKANPPGSSPAD